MLTASPKERLERVFNLLWNILDCNVMLMAIIITNSVAK